MPQPLTKCMMSGVDKEDTRKKTAKPCQDRVRQTVVDRGFCPAWSCSHSVPKKHTEVYINYKLVDLVAQAFLLTNSHILYQPIILVCVSHVAWYLYQRGILILNPLCLGDNCRLSLSSSQNSPVLVTPPILPAWLLANQHFIKPIQVTNPLSSDKTIVPQQAQALGRFSTWL